MKKVLMIVACFIHYKFGKFIGRILGLQLITVPKMVYAMDENLTLYLTYQWYDKFQTLIYEITIVNYDKRDTNVESVDKIDDRW